MFITSIVLAGILAGEPVPVLRAHGKPKTRKPPAAKIEAKEAIDRPKLDPSAWDYYPENLGCTLYDVVDAKGKFAYHLNVIGEPEYAWEGLIAVHDKHRHIDGKANLCLTITKSSYGWSELNIRLFVRSTQEAWYDGGNFVLMGNGSEWTRAAMKTFYSQYNNNTLRTVCLMGDFEKAPWLLTANDFEIRFGNLLLHLPEESLAAIRLMTRSSLDFAEKREDEGRQRLDQMIRLQDQSPIRLQDATLKESGSKEVSEPPSAPKDTAKP